jgi:Xaa-Pro aminopeptidase
MTRLGRLAERLDDPLLVTNPVNVRYLTGLSSSNAALLVESDGSTTLYTDFRYLAKARQVDGVTLVETARDLVGSLAGILAGRRVAFESGQLVHAAYARLLEGGLELVPAGGLVDGRPKGPVEDLRRVKEPGEVDAIRRAALLSDEMFTALSSGRFVGRTERQLAWWIERHFREAGASGLSFGAVVASGENGASPHADPGDRPIEAGRLVTVDAGCVVDSYCSDCTRTFATGHLPADLAEIYELCLEAQLAALDAVAPGAHGREVDAASRIAIGEAGYGEAYGHGLGHGVGLEIHEAPTLRPESQDTLEPGNVVTVEPGIYVPGLGGVRIEDLVLVTAESAERLTQFPKELITVS